MIENKNEFSLPKYIEFVAKMGWQADVFQELAYNELPTTFKHLNCVKPRFYIWRSRRRPKGIYIHGHVGRGKTALADYFYEHLCFEQKQRFHFHDFMNYIHGFLGERGNTPQAWDQLIKKISNDGWLLYIDEFNVTNIADASILHKLFADLFYKGVVPILTSNHTPDELYKDGLNYEQFAPFVKVLKRHVKVVEIIGKKDWRAQAGSNSNFYLGEKGLEALLSHLNDFVQAEGITKKGAVLNVNGRKLTLKHTFGEAAVFKFSELCSKALGTADYREIAQNFTRLYIHSVPALGEENADDLQRFIHFIDIVYDRKNDLFLHSEVPLHEIVATQENTEQQRLASRLSELVGGECLGL